MLVWWCGDDGCVMVGGCFGMREIVNCEDKGWNRLALGYTSEGRFVKYS